MDTPDRRLKTVRPIPAGSFIPAAFLVLAIFFLPTGQTSQAKDTLAVIFVSIVLEALPFMFAGALAGGLIEAFLSRERMAALLPRKRGVSVLISAAAGMMFPVCECAVVPVVRRLIGKGMPLSAAVAYLLGGPIVNPIVAASTALAYAFDWHAVVLRSALGYAIAVSAGLWMGRLFPGKEALREPEAERETPTCSCAVASNLQPITVASDGMDGACTCLGAHEAGRGGFMSRAAEALRHAADDFLQVGHYLVIGAFVAALAQTYVSRSVFVSAAEAPSLSIALLMLMAVALNLCSEADAFIAASFRWLTPWSAQLAFMLTGPMFDLKLLLMYQSIFKRRAIIVLATFILVAVFTAARVVESLGGSLRP